MATQQPGFGLVWRPGDLDGFLALALNNLITILLIIGLCRDVLGYPDSLVFGVILPATGISLLLGNLAYARQARVLELQEGRQDCTALPYGINTVSLFAYIFLVMLPVKLTALGAGLDESTAITRSWQAGMVACLGSGLIETAGAFCAHKLRLWLPRAALLSTLAGIALGHLAWLSAAHLRQPAGGFGEFGGDFVGLLRPCALAAANRFVRSVAGVGARLGQRVDGGGAWRLATELVSGGLAGADGSARWVVAGPGGFGALAGGDHPDGSVQRDRLAAKPR